MAWVNNTYFYRAGTLKAIAFGYEFLYSDAHIANLFSVAEFKADFDMALDSIGRSEWQGLTSFDFRDYRYFGRLQRVVIADILGITDYYLEGLGFYQIPQLRGRAYMAMVKVLNGEELPMAKARESRWDIDDRESIHGIIPWKHGGGVHPASGYWNGSWDNSVKLLEEKS